MPQGESPRVAARDGGGRGIIKRFASQTLELGVAKFQKRNPDVCVPEEQKSVMRDTPWGRMKYIDYKYKVEEYDKEDDQQFN